MKNKTSLTCLIVFAFLGFNLIGSNSLMSQNNSVLKIKSEKDKDEIQNLIRDMLVWSKSIRNIDIFPVKLRRNDSLFSGIDVERHKSNIEKLKSTNFFSEEFIENFNHIVITLNKKLIDNEYGEWIVYDMPPFNFLHVNPWCNCQDHLDFGSVIVNIVDAEKCEFIWKYGDIKPEYNPGWDKFEYKFNVIQVDGIWKISYLEGFDITDITK